MPKKISVLIADDHQVVRQGFCLLLATEPDVTVVGEADNGREAVRLTRELQPDVVVMDIAMPQLNGLAATRQILSAGIPTRVLILSAYDDDEFVHQLADAGASGYLLKQAAARELIEAVREVAKNNAYFSPAILKRLIESYRTPFVPGGAPNPRAVSLTSREYEVLQLVAEGQLNKQIAGTLGISIKTIEKHRQQLMNKLNLHDIAGLTRYAVAHGVVESPGGLKPALAPPAAE